MLRCLGTEERKKWSQCHVPLVSKSAKKARMDLYYLLSILKEPVGQDGHKI